MFEDKYRMRNELKNVKSEHETVSMNTANV